MTFAFHPFHDPHNLSNNHSLSPNPPSITAPTSLHEPAFPANYDAWGLAPTTFSPAQYGPPAGFHHGDQTHGLPLNMHMPDASSLLFGSYAPPLEISQLSPSTTLRHDTYESVLGNAFNPVTAPTGLAPQQTHSTISLPTLDFPCLQPPPSLPAPTPPAPASQSALSDPLQSTSPPERPACSKRVSKRKRKRSASREEDPDPYITSQPQADHGLQSYTTTTTPKSPNTSRAMLPFHGRGGRMGPPPVPPPQPGHHHQRSSPTSSGGQQQPPPQPGYPNVSVGSMDERSSKRRRVHDEQSPSGQSVAHQQQQMIGYPTQQYQSQNQAHWYGSGAQPTNAPMSQPSQPIYGYSSTSAGPSYSHHAPHAHAPTRTAPMYAAPIPTAPSQWSGGGGTQGQEQYYYTGAAAYSQPTQAYQQPQYTSPAHTTGTYQVHTPAGSASSGSGSIRPTPPMASGPMPPSATVNRPLSSSAGSKGAAAGPSAAVSAVGSQVPHRSGSGGNPAASGATAPVMMDSVIDVSGDDRFEHGPSEFPPKPYSGGEKAKSPWWPTRKTEKLYGSRLDQVWSSFLFLPSLSFSPINFHQNGSLLNCYHSLACFRRGVLFIRGRWYANFSLTRFTDARLGKPRCSP